MKCSSSQDINIHRVVRSYPDVTFTGVWVNQDVWLNHLHAALGDQCVFFPARSAQSSPGSWHFTYIIIFVSDILSVQLVNCDFVVVFCTCDIYCMSTGTGKGIPPLWLFLRFLPSLFHPSKSFFFFSQYGKFFPDSNQNRGCCSSSNF